MEFSKSLVEHDIFNPGDEIQMACLWFCFAHLLQDDLDKVKEHWNTHLILVALGMTLSVGDLMNCSFSQNFMVEKMVYFTQS